MNRTNRVASKFDESINQAMELVFDGIKVNPHQHWDRLGSTKNVQ